MRSQASVSTEGLCAELLRNRVGCDRTPQGADGVEQLVYYEIGVNGIWGGMFRGMSAPPCATALGLSASITRAWIW